MTESRRIMRCCAGFTALELIVVLLLLSIGLAFGLRHHAKSVKLERARDAARRLSALGTANRMFASDHGGRYAHRTRTAATLEGCPDTACRPCATPSCPSCSLFACRYADVSLGQTAHYWINAVSPREAGGCGLPRPETGSPMVACASAGEIRWLDSDAAPPEYEIVYHGWAYSYHEDGSIRPHRGAPPITPAK